MVYDYEQLLAQLKNLTFQLTLIWTFNEFKSIFLNIKIKGFIDHHDGKERVRWDSKKCHSILFNNQWKWLKAHQSWKNDGIESTEWDGKNT